MNRKALQCLCVILLGTFPVLGAGLSVYEQANQQFQAGDFAAAAGAYEKILAEDGPRAAVFYNLGNSYQSMGQFGKAILAYERARLINPRDADLLANLELARKAAAAFEDGGELRVHAALHYLSRNEWSWMVVGAALTLGGLALSCGVLGLPRGGLRRAAIGLTGLACLCMMVGLAALYQRRDEAHDAIVITGNAAVRLSPFEKAESLGTPGMGRCVRLRGHEAGFVFIEVPGTKLHGWLPDKEVALIIPTHSQ